MKLELGSGHRGTRGYVHHDAFLFPGIDIAANPWDLDYPDDSLEEVLALGFIEHLTYHQALDTFRNIKRMLQPDGQFLFDVPNYPVWARYYCTHMGYTSGVEFDQVPDLDWCRRTLFGWQRWPGDEHKWGWDHDQLDETLSDCGYTNVHFTVEPFIARTYRRRFHNPVDAHLYVVCS